MVIAAYAIQVSALTCQISLFTADGQLIILAAGDESLHRDCAGPWSVISKKAVFLGDTGAGARMKLVVNCIMGTMMTSLSEGLALAQASGLDAADLLSVLDSGAIANPMFRMKGPAMAAGGPFPPAFPLKHQQKDMRLALQLGDQLGVSMPVAAASNEAFKRARADGHGDNDFAAVHTSTTKGNK
jgi:glyoxylate/succinic semialdehyde reductase